MSNYLQKLIYLENKLDNQIVKQQINEVKEILSYASRGQVLAQAPQPLGLLPDEFEEILSQAGSEHQQDLTTLNHLLNSVRQYLSLKYGIWSVPNLTTASLIKSKLGISSALEVMAGNAYWSKALVKVGIKVKATDSLEWAKTSQTGSYNFMQVEDLYAVNAIRKYPDVDLILCSWSPNFGESDLALVKAWQDFSQARLLFIGEKEGATNSKRFWQEMKFNYSKELAIINASFQSFDFINEKIYEIKK